MWDIPLAGVAAGVRDLDAVATVAGNGGKKVAVVDSGRRRWAKVAVADNTWEKVAVAGNACEKLGLADNGGKKVAVPDFVEDNLVPRTGTELAGYGQVVVIPSGEAGHIGTHTAEVGGQVVEYVVLWTGDTVDLGLGS